MTLKREDLHMADFSDVATGDFMEPVHPGEILRDDFLEPLGITAYRLAKELHVPKNRITQIIRGERALSADTALRLSKFFGTSSKFWLGLQEQYDLDRAEEAAREDLAAIRPFAA